MNSQIIILHRLILEVIIYKVSEEKIFIFTIIYIVQFLNFK